MKENDDNGVSAAAAAASGGTGQSSRRCRQETVEEEEKAESPLRKCRMIKEIESCNNVGVGLVTPTKDNLKRSRKPVVAYQSGTANNQKAATAPSPLSDVSVIKKLQPTALSVDKEGFIGKRIAK